MDTHDIDLIDEQGKEWTKRERYTALREENARLTKAHADLNGYVERRVTEAERERDEARAEVARHKRNAECYACEAGDPDMDGVQDTKLSRAEAEVERLEAEVGRLRAITSPGDAAAFEEHMATREAHWVAQVKRLEGRVAELEEEDEIRSSCVVLKDMEIRALKKACKLHQNQVVRLEGMILDVAANGVDEYWGTLPDADAFWDKAKRIRAQREEE